MSRSELLIRLSFSYFVDDGDAPFALTAFGHTFYVITNAKHSAEVYKNTEALSFEEFVQMLMRTNGNDEQTIATVYSPLPVDKLGFPNPEGLSLGVLTQRMHVHQLHPGDPMAVLRSKAGDWISRQLRFDALTKATRSYAVSVTPDHIQIPLCKWTSDHFVRLGQYVYFGHVLDKINPNYADSYLVFDEVLWKMLYQYPNFLCHDMIKPRDEMMASLETYFKIPQNERRGEAAWIINAMEYEMRAIGVDNKNIAIMFFHLYFAINTNTRKTSFWMLTWLMRNPSWLTAFREETAPAFRGAELVDGALIQDSSRCPHVDAVWHETLRMAGWAASVRRVTRDGLVVGGRRLRQGRRVMVPHRLLHFDEALFGADPESWRPARWLALDGDGKTDGDDSNANVAPGAGAPGVATNKLSASPAWRPFGGGKTKCSGRFLAKYFVTTFVAVLLRRYDIQAVGEPPMPQPDVGRPVLGIISVKEGQDYVVSISERKEF
ncbi:hypothetical protein PG984_013663 [Apiospora sp. TS-2023a]